MVVGEERWCGVSSPTSLDLNLLTDHIFVHQLDVQLYLLNHWNWPDFFQRKSNSSDLENTVRQS
jgi:hypothetical protein